MSCRHSTRRWAALFALVCSAVAAWPAMAANCVPNNGWNINPVSQSVLEYDAANGYAPVRVTLGINKSLAGAGATAVWNQTDGPTVFLDTSNPQNPTFLTPPVTAAGATLTFRLVVTCPGVGTAPASLGTVSVINVNRPPVAYASATPSIAYAGDTIALNSFVTVPGTPPRTFTSNDPDGDTLYYRWTKTAGPAGLTLANATTAAASFVAPATGAPYTAQFQLEVRDRDTGGLASTASVAVSITPQALPPVAAVTCPMQVDEHGPVVLDGSGSVDPEHHALTYAWRQLTGSPAIQVGSEAGSIVRFDAPALTTGQDGFVEFELKVTDDTGLWDLATCGLQIVDATPPVISVPGDITVDAGPGAGAVVTYAVTAQDAVDDPSPYPLACVPPSSSLFPLGATRFLTTTVACSAHDSSVRPGFPNGNVANASFNVTVRDITPPAITVPGAFGVQATGPGGAVADFSASTSDAVDGPGSAQCSPAPGTVFPLGDTTVSCAASDARGNAAAPQSFVVTVFDTLAPALAGVSEDLTVEATEPAGAIATWPAPTAHDLVDGNRAVTCTPASGSTFALGHTPVTCAASDTRGNGASAGFTVTVVDTTPPALTLPEDTVTAEATSASGAPVSYAASASDAVDGSVAVACTPASGSTFALGNTTVACTATDAHGNTGHGSFVVTVVDTTPPALQLPEALVTAEAISASGAPVSYAASASDAVDGSVAVACTPASGSTFALGNTTVACTATDAHGNTGHGSFVVTVVDTTPPALQLPEAPVTAEAISASGAPVSYAASASDAVDGSVAVACTPASGSTFALGNTTVACTATDAHGNTGHGSFVVTVVDTTPPVVSVPAALTREATGPSGAAASFTASAQDTVSGTLPATCVPPSGSTFGLGAHTVTCSATDAAGNTGSAAFTLTVADTTPPVLTLPADITAEATSAAGAAVSYVARAQDLVDGSRPVSCTPAAGSVFALGTHVVTCAATDAHGNTRTGSFQVSVVDTTPPAMSPDPLPDVTATATGQSSAVVTYPLPTAYDLVDGAVAVDCSAPSGSSFAVGANTVTCTAQDRLGHRTTRTFTVRVNYAFSGFFQPIDMQAVNTAKAGSAIPVKFSLGGNQGLNIFAANSPASGAATCDAQAPTDEIEATVTAGGSTLQYDAASGQYIYVWKTDRSWLGCRVLKVTLRDGSVRTAVFKFR